jgi:hypothetical protein
MIESVKSENKITGRESQGACRQDDSDFNFDFELSQLSVQFCSGREAVKRGLERGS